jgi:hypothetical protein
MIFWIGRMGRKPAGEARQTAGQRVVDPIEKRNRRCSWPTYLEGLCLWDELRVLLQAVEEFVAQIETRPNASGAIASS